MTDSEVTSLVQNLAPNSAFEVSGNIDAVKELINRSEKVYLERKYGDVVVVWGMVAPSFIDDTVVVWCLFTNHGTDHGFTFIRQSRIILKELHRTHPRIKCYVRSIFPLRWAELIGFRKAKLFNDYWELEYHGH